MMLKAPKVIVQRRNVSNLIITDNLVTSKVTIARRSLISDIDFFLFYALENGKQQ